MLRRYSLFAAKGIGTPLVACVDGTTFHGGLADRWKGIVSLYALSLVLQRDFRIFYTYPFDLLNFQIPNGYNWRLAPQELSRNLTNVKMLRLAGDDTLSRVLNLPTDKQIHCYANRDWLPLINLTFHTDFQWGRLFNQLFATSPLLQKAMSDYQSLTDTPYIAVAFRMQNLLGDFPEYQYQPATPQRQLVITQACISFLHSLYEQHRLPLLVTSDSPKISALADSLPFVTISQGQSAHADTTPSAALIQYLKPFVDFYLLAGAVAVYAPATPEMYLSDFPCYAAKLNNIPFHRITLEV